MKCPICKKKVEDRRKSSNQNQELPHGVSKPAPRGVVEGGKRSPFLPFCSERCKLVDLGKWLDEKYVIPDDGFTPSPDNPKEDEG